MADFLTYTSSYLKEKGLLNKDIDPSLITPIIILVQDKYLHPILGTDLFNEIKAQIIAGTVSANNQTLLDEYIVKVMHWYVLQESTPGMKYRYMNKGVIKRDSEQSVNADLQEIQYLMDQWSQNAKMYAERLTNFLKAHTEDYPLFLENNDCDDIKPNNSNYRSSIYLGDDELSDRERYNIKIGNYE